MPGRIAIDRTSPLVFPVFLSFRLFTLKKRHRLADEEHDIRALLDRDRFTHRFAADHKGRRKRGDQHGRYRRRQPHCRQIQRND